MKRVTAFLIALALFFISVLGIRSYDLQVLKDKKVELTYFNSDVRNSCMEAMELVLDEHAVPVFGSSELSASDEIAYPPYLFQNGQSDFNMILMGRGYMQSIHHVMNVGAMAPFVDKKKVVLILSPQWFTQGHLTSETYASRFSERAYAAFMKNRDISAESKRRLTERMKVLLKADPRQLERIEKYEKIYLQHTLNPIQYIEMAVYDQFMEIKQLYELKKLVQSRSVEVKDEVKSKQIYFAGLMEMAEQAGREACTNNKFYIYNEYYDTYVRESEEKKKDSEITSSYLISPEYEDLRLFLDVCKETGIEPLLISVPVNGAWYDWIGFPKEDRDGYYQKIRDICSEYKVALADFSDKEYEPYFLKDVMHLGWKGWVYLDEAVYEFYNEIAAE